MSILKRIGSAVLAAVMILLVCCSCNQSATKVIMTIGKEEVPAGIYILYLNSAIGELETEIEEAEYEGDKWDFEIEGKKAAEWVKDKAIQYTLELVAVEREFKKRGLSFTADEQANIDYITNMYWSYYGYGKTYEKMGISYTSFQRVQQGSSLSQKMLLEQYGKDGSEPIPEEELKKYMEDNYMRVNHILISCKDEDGNELEGEALEKAEAEANTLFEAAKNSDDLVFIDMIIDNSADYNAERDTEASLELGMISTEEDSGYVEEFEKCAAELEPGKTDMCKSEYGWHIVRRYAMFGDDAVKFEDYHDDVVIEMKEEDYNKDKEAWANTLREEMVLVEKSFERYQPTDKKFNQE